MSDSKSSTTLQPTSQQWTGGRPIINTQLVKIFALRAGLLVAQ
jgi:hypothetical protein